MGIFYDGDHVIILYVYISMICAMHLLLPCGCKRRTDMP